MSRINYDQVEVVDHWLAFQIEMEEAIEELEGAEEQEDIDLPEDPIDRAVMLGREHTLKPDQQAELNRRILMRSTHEHELRLSRYLPQFVEAFRRAAHCRPACSSSVCRYPLATAATAVVVARPIASFVALPVGSTTTSRRRQIIGATSIGAISTLTTMCGSTWILGFGHSCPWAGPSQSSSSGHRRRRQKRAFG